MTDFLLCIGRYVVEMAALALIGGLGAFIGIRLRRHKDAKADTTKENLSYSFLLSVVTPLT